MKKVERCYLCNTTFQMFVCMHMQLHDDCSADLYISDKYGDYRVIASNIEKTHLFRKVVIMNSKKLYKTNNKLKKNSVISKFILYCNVITTYINIDDIVSSFVDKNVIYNKLLIPDTELCFRLIRYYYIKHNYPTRYYMYEEGTGSYSKQFEKFNPTNLLICRIMFGKKASKKRLNVYLFRPVLLDDESLEDRKIIKIPFVDEVDKEYYKRYCDVFKRGDYSTYNNKIIYFDTVREEIIDGDEALKKVDFWNNVIIKKLGASNVIIKPHPRAVKDYKYDKSVEFYANKDVPIDIDYLSYDLDNMILISIMSTTVVNPKVIFNKEPVVLLLCYMDESVYKPPEALDVFFKGVYNMYKDKSKFFMPKSYEELVDNLKTIKEKYLSE